MDAPALVVSRRVHGLGDSHSGPPGLVALPADCASEIDLRQEGIELQWENDASVGANHLGVLSKQRARMFPSVECTRNSAIA